MRGTAKLAAVMLSTALLAACQTPLPAPAQLPPAVPCPAVVVKSMAWQAGYAVAALTGVSAVCHVVGNNLSISLDATFAANRLHPGPAVKLPAPYTVTIEGTAGAVLSRETFQTTLQFAPGSFSLTQHEHLHQVVPVGAGNPVPTRLTVELGSEAPDAVMPGAVAP